MFQLFDFQFLIKKHGLCLCSFLFLGQIYRLKRPSSQYLASVLTYDSSNPTRDWGFPPLSLNSEIQQLPRIVGPGAFEEASSPSEHPHVLKKVILAHISLFMQLTILYLQLDFMQLTIWYLQVGVRNSGIFLLICSSIMRHHYDSICLIGFLTFVLLL